MNGLSNDRYLKHGVANNQSGTIARIWSIAEDKTGNIWFGTVDAGVWRDDGTTLTNFTTNSGLRGNGIGAICKDNAGDLWFGTNEGGVYKYDGKSFTAFTEVQ